MKQFLLIFIILLIAFLAWEAGMAFCSTSSDVYVDEANALILVIDPHGDVWVYDYQSYEGWYQHTDI